MKILLAFSDRDMLSGYKRLFELCGHSTAEAFDGVKAIEYIVKDNFDIAIVERAIPRAGIESIITQLKDRFIPSVVVCEKRIRSEELQTKTLANTYIAYPFTPDEMNDRINKILFKIKDGDITDIYGVEVNEKKFTLGNVIPVTNEELDVLKSVYIGKNVDTVHMGTYIRSLNNKFAKLGKNIRIEYSVDAGYRVTNG